MRRLAIMLSTPVILAAGCGGKAETEMVWCVGPGEEVTPAFEREYPELYMSKAECDMFDKAFSD